MGTKLSMSIWIGMLWFLSTSSYPVIVGYMCAAVVTCHVLGLSFKATEILVERPIYIKLRNYMRL